MKEIERLAKLVKEQKTITQGDLLTVYPKMIGVMYALAVRKWKETKAWECIDASEDNWAKALVQETLVILGDRPQIKAQAKDECYTALTAFFVAIILETLLTGSFVTADYYTQLEKEASTILNNPVKLKTFADETEEDLTVLRDGVEFLFVSAS